MKQHFFTKKIAHYFATGFAMGAADIVPGVSGGTVAFILGVYERLISTIKLMSSEVLALILRGRIREAIALVPFSFLLPLGLGLASAIVLLSSILRYVLYAYPVFVWSFFFGLVLASIWVVSKRIKQWSPSAITGLITAAIVGFLIVGLVPVETPATPLAFFLAGMIAICAMILPGVSGAFLLLVMGKYEQVITAVSDRDIMTILFVGIGAIVGLALFSRLLSWLFKTHENITIAVLTGFMIGSLRKIWPWKEALTTRINSHGFEVAVSEINILPPAIDLAFFTALSFCLLAVALVLLLDRNHLVESEQ